MERHKILGIAILIVLLAMGIVALAASDSKEETVELKNPIVPTCCDLSEDNAEVGNLVIEHAPRNRTNQSNLSGA